MYATNECVRNWARLYSACQWLFGGVHGRSAPAIVEIPE